MSVENDEAIKEDDQFCILSSLRYDVLLRQSSINQSLSGPDAGPSALYMLQFHRDRMLVAAEYFQWHAAASRLDSAEGLTDLELLVREKAGGRSVCSHREPPLKVRVCLDKHGVFSVDVTPVSRVGLRELFPAQLDHPEKMVDPNEASSTTSQDPSSVRRSRSMNSWPWRVYIDDHPTGPCAFTRYKTTKRDTYTQARERAGIRSFSESAEVVLVNASCELMEGSLTSVYLFREGKWVTPPLTSGGHDGTTRRYSLDRGLCVERVITKESVRHRECCYLSNGVRGFIRGRVELCPVSPGHLKPVLE